MEITDLYPWLERPAAALRKMRDKLPGGVLIYGPRGSGAYELAASFAASVVCSSPKDGVACGSCADCRLVQAGTHPDLKYVLSETEAALRPEPWNGKIQPLPKGKSFSKQILIEQVREIGEYLSVTAFRSDHRAVLIYPADSMGEDQSSALLKTLEEPPEYTVILILTARILVVLRLIIINALVPVRIALAALNRGALPIARIGIRLTSLRVAVHCLDRLFCLFLYICIRICIYRLRIFQSVFFRHIVKIVIHRYLLLKMLLIFYHTMPCSAKGNQMA